MSIYFDVNSSQTHVLSYTFEVNRVIIRNGQTLNHTFFTAAHIYLYNLGRNSLPSPPDSQRNSPKRTRYQFFKSIRYECDIKRRHTQILLCKVKALKSGNAHGTGSVKQTGARSENAVWCIHAIFFGCFFQVVGMWTASNGISINVLQIQTSMMSSIWNRYPPTLLTTPR